MKNYAFRWLRSRIYHHTGDMLTVINSQPHLGLWSASRRRCTIRSLWHHNRMGIQNPFRNSMGLALLAFLAPEFPWHLIRTGDNEGALRSIKRLSSNKTDNENRAQLAMMQHTNQLEMDISAGTSYWDCFKGIDRRRTEIVCTVRNTCTAPVQEPPSLTLPRSLPLNRSAVVPWEARPHTFSSKPASPHQSRSK